MSVYYSTDHLFNVIDQKSKLTSIVETVTVIELSSWNFLVEESKKEKKRIQKENNLTWLSCSLCPDASAVCLVHVSLMFSTMCHVGKNRIRKMKIKKSPKQKNIYIKERTN